jgi:hypothetical protein
MNGIRKYPLVLAAYLNSRGVAFVLFESALSPFDWGIKDMRGPRRHSRSLYLVSKLFDRYEPDVLVIQDTSLEGTRRGARIVKLNAAIAALARQHHIPVYAYSRADIRAAFGYLGVPSKEMIAGAIAKHILAFHRYLPPPRKPWKSEDARMGMFDAAALGIVFFQRQAQHQGPDRSQWDDARHAQF